MNDLHSAEKVHLIRAQNGWIVRDHKNEGFKPNTDCFVFDSTESLTKNLVKLLGKSWWTVEANLPERDDKAHFKPKP